jgi:hypothetical protein
MVQEHYERDWPVGHPASADYKGQKYDGPPAPFQRDWPVGHPKAADSPANIAESKAVIAEQQKPGALGVPNSPVAADPQLSLQSILAAGETFAPATTK